VEWQYSALMTQSCPRGSEQKDFNVFLSRFLYRPHTNFAPVFDLEIRNVLNLYKGALFRMLEHKSARTFRLGRSFRLDLNYDVNFPCVVRQGWQPGERDFGMRAPPT
jgi:hypothetical protein